MAHCRDVECIYPESRGASVNSLIFVFQVNEACLPAASLSLSLSYMDTYTLCSSLSRLLISLAHVISQHVSPPLAYTVGVESERRKWTPWNMGTPGPGDGLFGLGCTWILPARKPMDILDVAFMISLSLCTFPSLTGHYPWLWLLSHWTSSEDNDFMLLFSSLCSLSCHLWRVVTAHMSMLLWLLGWVALVSAIRLTRRSQRPAHRTRPSSRMKPSTHIPDSGLLLCEFFFKHWPEVTTLHQAKKNQVGGNFQFSFCSCLKNGWQQDVLIWDNDGLGYWRILQLGSWI